MHTTIGNVSLQARRMAAAVASAALLITAQTAAAPIAHAAATPPSSCTWGQTWIGIDSAVKPYYITHALLISVAPGATYSQSTSVTKVASITADVTGSVTGMAEENLIIEKAGIQVGLSLKVSGTATISGSVTHTWTLSNSSSSQKRYVLYTAPHKVTGTWTKWQCDRWEKYSIKLASGTLGSWDVESYGTALCGMTYSSTSAEKKAQAFCP